MGWRFSRRIRVLPGVRLNVSKGGISTSVGGRGAWLTVGKRGSDTSLGVPGTGIRYTTHTPPGSDAEQPSSSRGASWLTIFVALALVGWALTRVMR